MTRVCCWICVAVNPLSPHLKKSLCFGSVIQLTQLFPTHQTIRRWAYLPATIVLLGAARGCCQSLPPPTWKMSAELLPSIHKADSRLWSAATQTCHLSAELSVKMGKVWRRCKNIEDRVTYGYIIFTDTKYNKALSCQVEIPDEFLILIVKYIVSCKAGGTQNVCSVYITLTNLN